MDPNARLRVAEVMTSPVRWVDPDATVAAAAERMSAHDVGSLVVDGEDEPSGIVTTTDLVRSVGAGADPGSRSVAGVMSSPVETVVPDRPLRDAARRMSDRGIKHLPVDGGDLVGMVSSTDLTAYLPRFQHPK